MDYTYTMKRFFHFLEHRPTSERGIVVFDELEKSKGHLLIGQGQSSISRDAPREPLGNLVLDKNSGKSLLVMQQDCLAAHSERSEPIMQPFTEISVVRPKAGLTGRKYVVTVGEENHEFPTEEEAQTFRHEQVARRARSLTFNYDRDREYITVAVVQPPLPDQQNSLFGWFGKHDTGLGQFVDTRAFEEGINHACEQISGDGYEVIAIVPMTAGVGAWRMNQNSETRAGAGAGWGFSFTQGVLVTARKRPGTTA